MRFSHLPMNELVRQARERLGPRAAALKTRSELMRALEAATESNGGVEEKPELVVSEFFLTRAARWL